jgi:hypothetical protein
MTRDTHMRPQPRKFLEHQGRLIIRAPRQHLIRHSESWLPPGTAQPQLRLDVFAFGWGVTIRC